MSAHTAPQIPIRAGHGCPRSVRHKSRRHHFDGLSILRRRLACQLIAIPLEMCVHIIATIWQQVISKDSREAQRHLAFFVPNLESNAENQISSAEEPQRLVKSAKGVR